MVGVVGALDTYVQHIPLLHINELAIWSLIKSAAPDLAINRDALNSPRIPRDCVYMLCHVEQPMFPPPLVIPVGDSETTAEYYPPPQLRARKKPAANHGAASPSQARITPDPSLFLRREEDEKLVVR